MYFLYLFYYVIVIYFFFISIARDFVVKNESLYDSNSATDFELHASEETELVIKILSLAGITIKDPSLYQVGDKEEIEKIQQEKL